MVLNTLYVCLTHSLFVKNHPIWILEDGSLVSRGGGGVVTASIRARSGLNIHSKHLKITTKFTVRMLSPYKDYSSL
jgi:hypothetical protein